MRHRREIVLTP